MKKVLLIIPAGVLAATGFFWMNHDRPLQPPQAVTISGQDPQSLFSESERSLREIVRKGDSLAIASLDASTNALIQQLDDGRRHGMAVDTVENLLDSYREDTRVLSEKISPYLNALEEYDRFEHQHRETFLTALDQIGLYELKTSFDRLDKTRLEYIKSPSAEQYRSYVSQVSAIRSLIAELYLDAPIEQPLLSYLSNHAHYCETLSTAFNDIGLERIRRLRNNAYAIRTELQLLPRI